MTGIIKRSMAGATSTTGRAAGRGPRLMAGLAATAALALGLLGVLVFSLARPAAQPSEPSGVRVNPYWAYTEDDVSAGNPAAPAFVPDQITYREDHRAINPGGSGCVAASAAGVPGEGCGTAPLSLSDTVFVPDQFVYREDHRGER
jgi:hypothetical protein